MENLNRLIQPNRIHAWNKIVYNNCYIDSYNTVSRDHKGSSLELKSFDHWDILKNMGNWRRISSSLLSKCLGEFQCHESNYYNGSYTEYLCFVLVSFYRYVQMLNSVVEKKRKKKASLFTSHGTPYHFTCWKCSELNRTMIW